MLITSPVFESDEPIPAAYSCEGGNKNPALEILEVPDEAKSLALIMDDPDAPNGTYLHWMAWNMHPSTSLISEGFRAAEAGGLEGQNGNGAKGYTGPCPPRGSGVHHYHFKLYALDAELDLPESAEKDELESAINLHKIAEAELVGTFEREAS